MTLSQGKYWLELQKVQHIIRQTLEHCRDPERKPRARSPTAMLEQMKDRTRSISQDMHLLSQSCGEEIPDTSAGASTKKEAQSTTEEGEGCKTGLQRHNRGDSLLD